MSVSVVMATYCGERYIIEQLDSIVCQLGVGDEIIICDDCSSDNTVAVIRDYITQKHLENIIHITINEKNLGFQNNFNKAMKLAQNEYIFFSDQDDVWLDTKIADMVKIMKENTDC